MFYELDPPTGWPRVNFTEINYMLIFVWNHLTLQALALILWHFDFSPVTTMCFSGPASFSDVKVHEADEMGSANIAAVIAVLSTIGVLLLCLCIANCIVISRIVRNRRRSSNASGAITNSQDNVPLNQEKTVEDETSEAEKEDP